MGRQSNWGKGSCQKAKSRLKHKKKKKKAMQVHNDIKRESAKSQRVRTCDPILIQLSMSSGSPQHLKGPEEKRCNSLFLLPVTPCTGRKRSLEWPPCWVILVGILRQHSHTRLRKRAILPEKRKWRKTMTKLEKGESSGKASRIRWKTAYWFCYSNLRTASFW